MPRGMDALAREIEDVENWIASLNDDLDFLAELARRCTTDECRRAIEKRVRAKLARLNELRERRRRLAEQGEPN